MTLPPKTDSSITGDILNFQARNILDPKTILSCVGDCKKEIIQVSAIGLGFWLIFGFIYFFIEYGLSMYSDVTTEYALTSLSRNRSQEGRSRTANWPQVLSLLHQGTYSDTYIVCLLFPCTLVLSMEQKRCFAQARRVSTVRTCSSTQAGRTHGRM